MIFSIAAPALDPAQQPQEQAAQPAADSPTGGSTTLHGMVRNAVSGQPLPRALVRVEGEASTGALTDGDGRFEIPGIPLGPQSIRVLKPGFRDRPYATEDIGYQSDGPAHSVLVAAQMADLDFSLIPTCVIHGHVDLSTGDPAEHMQVVLAKQIIRNGRAVWAQEASTVTNSDGFYRFPGLPSGVYVVYTPPALESEPAVAAIAPGSAADVARNSYASVFYPDARDFASATRIRLMPGDEIQANLSLTLEPFHPVTVTAVLPNGKPFEPGGGAVFQSAQVLDAQGRRLPYAAQYDSETHTIQTALPDGSFSLMVAVALSDPPVMLSPGKATRPPGLSGMADFTVAGHSITNLRLALAPVPSWPVRISTIRTVRQTTPPNAGRGLQSQVIVSVSDASDAVPEGAGQTYATEPAGSDHLDLSGTGFGPSWISAQVNDRSLCVDSFTAGGANLAREPLRLTPNTGAPAMELTLRDDCSKLELELPAALASFVPGDEPFYNVYVIPDFDTTVDIPPVTVHPSSGAVFTLEGLTPGSYHVYTFDSPVRLEYRNSAVLAALSNPGQSVTLSPGTTGHLVLEASER